MNDEERIRAYLQHRADVAVPDDLRLPTSTPMPRRRWTGHPAGGWARVSIAGLIVAVVLVGVALSLPTPIGPGTPSTPASGGSVASTGRPPDAAFPARVAGLPVISVAQAADLLGSGKLDGQAVAVAGYYDAFVPSCPAPSQYIGPLEGWCRFSALGDTRAGVQLCQPMGDNGMSCSQPTGTFMSPFFMNESSGDAWSWLTGGATGEPAALVLIGHAGDPRQWLCTTSMQASCAHAFVVDRIAWAEGRDVPLAAPATGDQQSGAPLTPRMTLAQVAAAAGLGDSVVSGAPFKAGDIATIDPRWSFAGNNLVWLVRTAASSTGAPTAAETVWLIDDATGKAIDSEPMKLDPTYQPARLWLRATVHGVECCTGDVTPFERISSAEGTAAHEGIVSGSAEGSPSDVPAYTTFGGGYGSPPVVLPAGKYSIAAWLGTYAAGVTGSPQDACSTQITLGLLDNLALNADFPAGHACTFQPAPVPSPDP
ncbi:MAG TPA: hypothetical protein VGM49_07250 [Candidatus Limnocylindrales bacterium]